jgi:hypothetical protein
MQKYCLRANAVQDVMETSLQSYASGVLYKRQVSTEDVRTTLG